MRLAHGLLLTHCLRVPEGVAWAEASGTLRAQILAGRDAWCDARELHGISLQLGARISRELIAPRPLVEFRRWLEAEGCYVCALSEFIETAGLPGESENQADWAHPERLAHTCRLLDLLGELLPAEIVGSVGVLPGALAAGTGPEEAGATLQAVYANLIRAAIHAAEVSGRTGRPLRLALGPARRGLFEDAAETVRFLEPLIDAFPDQFGVCFDPAYFAAISGGTVKALDTLHDAEIPLVRLRLDLTPPRLRAAADELPGVLDWLAADLERCAGVGLEVLVADAPTIGCRQILDGLRARGLA